MCQFLCIIRVHKQQLIDHHHFPSPFSVIHIEIFCIKRADWCCVLRIQCENLPFDFVGRREQTCDAVRVFWLHWIVRTLCIVCTDHSLDTELLVTSHNKTTTQRGRGTCTEHKYNNKQKRQTISKEQNALTNLMAAESDATASYSLPYHIHDFARANLFCVWWFLWLLLIASIRNAMPYWTERPLPCVCVCVNAAECVDRRLVELVNILLYSGIFPICGMKGYLNSSDKINTFFSLGRRISHSPFRRLYGWCWRWWWHTKYEYECMTIAHMLFPEQR